MREKDLFPPYRHRLAAVKDLEALSFFQPIARAVPRDADGKHAPVIVNFERISLPLVVQHRVEVQRAAVNPQARIPVDDEHPCAAHAGRVQPCRRVAVDVVQIHARGVLEVACKPRRDSRSHRRR